MMARIRRGLVLSTMLALVAPIAAMSVEPAGSAASTADRLTASAFAHHADQVIRPLVSDMPGYAGNYQDQAKGGRIVVLATSLSASSHGELAVAFADVPYEIRSGVASTFAELEAASDRLLLDRRSWVQGATVRSVGIDEEHNRLIVGVTDLWAVDASATARLVGDLGVDVSVIDASPVVNEAQQCDATGRSYCFDPMQAGTLVYSGAPQSQECTMGYHVQQLSQTSVKGFLTAGHCGGWPTNNKNWYMDVYVGPIGNGFVGSRKATLYQDQGYDCQVIGMPSAQASRQIYDTSRAVAGSGNPVQGETLWISPGRTDEDTNNGNDSGTVQTAQLSIIDTNFLIIRVTSVTGLSTRSGDSGSPVYRAYGGGAIAIGVHQGKEEDGSPQFFTRVPDCLSQMGYSVH